MDTIISLTFGFLIGVGFCIRHVLRASRAAEGAGENWYQSQIRLNQVCIENNRLAQTLERERAAKNKGRSS